MLLRESLPSPYSQGEILKPKEPAKLRTMLECRNTKGGIQKVVKPKEAKGGW